MNSPSFGPPPPTLIKLGHGPGKVLASVEAIVGVSIYYGTIVIIIIYCFISLWPESAPTGTKSAASNQIQTGGIIAQTSKATQLEAVSSTNADAPITNNGFDAGLGKNARLEPEQHKIFGLYFKLHDDVRLFVLVLLAGALGTCVHALRSISWYVGNRAFVTSWLMYYYLKPLVGMGLAATFYFVIRGGFFSSSSNFNDTSPFGFCAVGALIGLFSEGAILKLKDIADIIFLKPKSGADAVPQSANSDQSTPAARPPQSMPKAAIPGAPNPPPPKH